VAAALNTGGAAAITSVSCASAGNCTAGGYYEDSSFLLQGFVVSETNGTWGTAAAVAAALNTGGEAAITSVSCASAGNCTAGGYYKDSSGHEQAFVISQTNGTWGKAKEVAAALNTGGTAAINEVSCASAGNCSAGGQYANSTPATEAFVADETNGTWGKAKEVAAALNTGGTAVLYAVSCAADGTCSAGGDYTNSTPATEAFVISKP
jgi:hypothetical protein